jgi:hypothetical protein
MADHSNDLSWTTEMLRDLFVAIRERFGPKTAWVYFKSVPDEGAQALDEFLAEWAKK